MSNGPITKSSRSSSAGRQVAGIALILQSALRAFFLVRFLLVISRNPRFSEAIFGNVYPLTMSVLLPAAFTLAGVVAGIMLLFRLRAGAALAGAFCLIGLLSLGFGAFQFVLPVYRSHPPPMLTYLLMALNGAVYVGTLIAITRSA